MEIKFKQILELLSFGNFPNNEELLQSYEALRKLLSISFSTESCLEIIKAVKNNQCYRQFKLETDPQFFKAIVSKVDKISMIEKLLELSLEINYSTPEKKVLHQQLNILILLSILDSDLKREAVFDEEEEDMDDQNDFFEVYFEEFKQLKETFFSERITPENIQWFLHSDLFEFISRAADCFDVDLEDLYQCMLENAYISTKKDFICHKQILENARKEIYFFDYKAFYSILRDTKKQLANHVRGSAGSSNYNNFYKPPKAAGLSPIAREALLNNLRKYLSPSF
jgi:hypothetical protein